MKNILLYPYCFLLAIVLLLCPSKAEGQGWIRFNYPYTSDIIPHPDGGVLVAYSNLSPKEAKVARVDEDGYLIWEKTVLGNARSLDLEMDDNGQLAVLVFNFTADKLALVYFDLDGNPVATHQTADFYQPSSQIAAYPGGGMVADVLYKANFFASPTRLDIHRYDSQGQVLWSSPVDTLVESSLLAHKGLAVNSLGQTIVGYRTGIATSPKYHLMVLDANGDSLWRRDDLMPLTVGRLADDNFFYVVQQNAPDFHYLLRKIDPAGSVLWEQIIDFSALFIAEGKYIATPDGGLVLCGTGIGLEGKTIVVQVFDNQGNVVQNIRRPLPGYAANDLTVGAIAAASNGGYYLTGEVMVNNNLSQSFLVKMDADGNIYPQRIWGIMAEDVNDNCVVDPGELGLEGHKVKIEDLATGHTFYASSDSLGLYVTETDSTEFVLSALISNPYWETCQPDTLVSFDSGADSIQVDFPLKKVVECAFLEVDISTSGLRRCFDNTYYVRYCNTGTAAAENAYVEVKLDPYLDFLSSSIPGVEVGNQLWRFQVGHLDYGDCGNFSLLVHLDCDSTVLGQTHCTEAHIYPDSFCLQNGAWSGANVDVNGVCNPDSVDLIIRNIGTAPNAGPLNYVIIEDNIIFRTGNFQLPANDSLVIRVPSNGSTWRLEAEQEPFSPGDPMPSATVEGCGANENGQFSIGFVSQFGEDDGNPYVSVDCQENKGAFDPNDKQGFPKGVGDEHWIEPGTELEYLIRFQNTGTDTAFTVVVRDALAEWLDPASVRAGVSSHPYAFRLSGTGKLEFTFNHILLPDSTTNEPASHGFVKFFVKVRPDVPQGTLLQNSAAIYFDFNAPVITNTTTHKVGVDFLLSRVVKVPTIVPGLEVSPNPATDQTVVYFKDIEAKNGRLEVLDIQGRVVARQNFTGHQAVLKIGEMTPGLYLIRAYEGDRWLGNGKVVWQRL